MKIIADLHSHSTHSDGELPPEQLVDLAAERGVQVLALTDHDAVSGVPAAIERGRVRGVEIIPGCELTAYEGGIELHILALFVDIGPSATLTALLQKMQDARRTRALAMAAKLRATGLAIDDADVLEAAGGARSIGRPHVAAALVKRGHAPTVNGAIVKFLLEGGAGHVPKYALTPEESFAAVRSSGGVALLAHPGSCPHDELITPLFRRGMDGVEAYYRGHSDVNRRFYAGLARRYEKVVSGGSDYHGPTVRPGVLPGDGGVDQPTLAELRRLAKARATL
jgi:3',5'-nucleoside bisphosphate phosphatase